LGYNVSLEEVDRVKKKMNRRHFLRMAGGLVAGAAVSACQPQTVIVEKEVEKTVVQIRLARAGVVGADGYSRMKRRKNCVKKGQQSCCYPARPLFRMCCSGVYLSKQGKGWLNCTTYR
jgi:hypothetical protein